VTLTQLFPILSDGLELQRKAYLVPATITVSFVVALFLAVGHATAFNLLLAIYLAGACYYVIYRLCGKPKPWWVLVSTAVLSAIVLRTPVLPWFATIFRDILPGQVPLEGESIPFPALLVRMFFGAGLMEELLKILPVLFWLGMGLRLRSPWKQRCGVLEPLDGILLGAASAIGLTLMETLGQYVPSMIQNTQLQAGTDLSHLQLMGLQLLIPRLLGSIAGHIAYSGYLGYFVGLAVLQPQHRWRILGIGYMTTSALHALWNATGIVSPLLLALVGILSYAFLAAAIVKARLLSPTRAQNFATRLK
jgi:RsiW-degrading membrane proteinase PrsW (M82 family)